MRTPSETGCYDLAACSRLLVDENNHRVLKWGRISRGSLDDRLAIGSVSRLDQDTFVEEQIQEADDFVYRAPMTSAKIEDDATPREYSHACCEQWDQN